MRSFLVAFLLFPLAFATPPPADNEECDFHPSVQEMEIAQEMYLNATGGTAKQLSGHGIGDPIEVYWHTAMSGSAYEEGNVPLEHIENAMEFLNSAFIPGSISFKLVEVTRTVNATWFNAAAGSPDNNSFIRTLRRGICATLNIFTINLADGGPIHSAYPWRCQSGLSLDGILIRYNALPGGPLTSSNIGVALVHAVGHWMGLYHTFTGGCSEPGDYVSDTPASASPTFGCAPTRDSCPSLPGLDPVTNYMDLSDRRCRNNFTLGQYGRMKTVFTVFRN